MPSVCRSVLPCPFLVHVQPFFTTNNYWKLLTCCITQAGFPDPHNPSNLPPKPEKTRTCESGLGFHQVRVGVALKPPWGDPCQSLVESVLQMTCHTMGVQVLFLPKFHCELNFIKQVWGHAKCVYCQFPPSSKESDLEKNVIQALDSVLLLSMHQ